LAAPGHIGFFSGRKDPIGSFQTLLYVPDHASPDDLIGPIEHCIGSLPEATLSEPGSASATMLVALDGLLSVSVKMADRINPNISWFYRLDLGEAPTLRVFEVPALGPESRFDPEAASAWAAVSVPADWMPHSERALR
jgi:hypothetical protein